MNYTEKDFVFKSSSINEIVENCNNMNGQRVEGLRREITSLCNQVKKENSILKSKKANVEIGFDANREEYFFIKRDIYDPANMFSVLFDILTEYTDLDVDKEIEEKSLYLEKYFKRVEEFENFKLTRECSELKELISKMVNTISVLEQEQDYEEVSYGEIERLADAIDKEFYQPIEEIFNSILDKISKERIELVPDKKEE